MCFWMLSTACQWMVLRVFQGLSHVFFIVPKVLDLLLALGFVKNECESKSWVFYGARLGNVF